MLRVAHVELQEVEAIEPLAGRCMEGHLLPGVDQIDRPDGTSIQRRSDSLVKTSHRHIWPRHHAQVTLTPARAREANDGSRPFHPDERTIAVTTTHVFAEAAPREWGGR